VKEVVSVLVALAVMLFVITSFLMKAPDESVLSEKKEIVPAALPSRDNGTTSIGNSNPTTATRSSEKCYPTKIDPSWNRNDNKPGSACYKQMAKVRKLEFDPMFDCSSEIRKSWQRELEIAERMECKL
jgi:hypothetical protein